MEGKKRRLLQLEETKRNEAAVIAYIAKEWLEEIILYLNTICTKWIRFGLILPKKVGKFAAKVQSIFDSEDSEDNVTESTKQKNEPSGSRIETEKGKKITDEDPNIYEYDSIYDEIKGNQLKKNVKPVNKEPRYITSLLKAAEKRKKESERRVERKIQNERNKEGDSFKEKEAFVTSAYRRKMLEMEEEEEREQRESQFEDIMDITKQKDLSGFYRHFLKQTVGEEQVPKFGERHSLHKKDDSQSKEENGKSSSLSECLKNKNLSDAPTDKDQVAFISDRKQQNRNRVSAKKDKRQVNDCENSTLQKYDSDEIVNDHHSNNQSTRKYAEKSSHHTLSSSKTKEKHKSYSSAEQYSSTEMNANKHSHNQNTPKYKERNLHHTLSPENKLKDKHRTTHKNCFSSAEQDSSSETEDSNRKDRRSYGINKRKQPNSKDDREYYMEEEGMTLHAKSYDESVIKKSLHSNEKKKKRMGDDTDLFEHKIARNTNIRVEQNNSKGKECEQKDSKKDLISKFTKRTVGIIFEEAKARYLERQMLRKMTPRTSESA